MSTQATRYERDGAEDDPPFPGPWPQAEEPCSRQEQEIRPAVEESKTGPKNTLPFIEG